MGMLLKLPAVGNSQRQVVEDVFNAYTYTGNASTQTITNGVDLSTHDGMVWTKKRSAAYDHYLFDTLRGVNVALKTNSTAGNDSGSDMLTAFNSNGFDIGSSANVNGNTATYVSWTFREALKFFDVVMWTGDGTNGRTLTHSLGQAPGMILVKRTDTGGDDWSVYHRSIGGTGRLRLNTTDATQTTVGAWNNTDATSAVFSVHSSLTNASGATYIAYLFAHDTGTDGLIQCGSFNGVAGTEVTLGWEPQFILEKAAGNTDGWRIWDSMRGIPTEGTDPTLQANTSGAEFNTTDYVNVGATGFTPVSAGHSNVTYIYMAIRRGPMRQPTSGTQVYNAIARTAVNNASVTGVGFPPDFILETRRTTSAEWTIDDRLRGVTKSLVTSSTAAETTTNRLVSFNMDGFTEGAYWDSYSVIYQCLRRWPGVFDQVCYTGNSVDPTLITHNLAVAPEMVIVKMRNASNDWVVWHSSFGNASNTNNIYLNSVSSTKTNSGLIGSTTPTSTTFKVGDSAFVNSSGNTYSAWLFSTLAGISKVGSYTGNGTSQTIDCGFSAGARLVLIKRTDTSDHWYVFDSTRGIVAGNDPLLRLSSTVAEETTNDEVDPASSGFIVNETTNGHLNVNSATYIYLAFA